MCRSGEGGAQTGDADARAELQNALPAHERCVALQPDRQRDTSWPGRVAVSALAKRELAELEEPPAASGVVVVGGVGRIGRRQGEAAGSISPHCHLDCHG